MRVLALNFLAIYAEGGREKKGHSYQYWHLWALRIGRRR